ncbi:MAG: hypothetical protein FJX72_09380, partial [Armatimonadetes bacterium]|nr:hypothetical protein [Armatimonadota bacterium]
MTETEMGFVPVRRSLADLIGSDRVEAACAARAALTGEEVGALRDAAQQPVEFLPEPMIARMESLLQRVGDVLTAPAPSGSPGAF